MFSITLNSPPHQKIIPPCASSLSVQQFQSFASGHQQEMGEVIAAKGKFVTILIVFVTSVIFVSATTVQSQLFSFADLFCFVCLFTIFSFGLIFSGNTLGLAPFRGSDVKKNQSKMCLFWQNNEIVVEKKRFFEISKFFPNFLPDFFGNVFFFISRLILALRVEW